MLYRPAVRTLDSSFAQIGDARQESLGFRERADHALISARAGSHVLRALATQRRRGPLNANRPPSSGHTMTAFRAPRRLHRQGDSRGDWIRCIARPVPIFRSVELLNTGAAARACARICGQFIGQEASCARRRAHARRTIHGRRGVREPGIGNRHHLRTRRSRIAHLSDPEQGRGKPSARTTAFRLWTIAGSIQIWETGRMFPPCKVISA